MIPTFPVFVLFAILASLVSADLKWSNCGSPEDTLDLKSISYFPEVPVRGQMLNVTVNGVLKQPVDTGSKVKLGVKWGIIRLPVPDVDICKELDGAPEYGFKCPLKPDTYSITQGFVLSPKIPDGKFDVLLRLNDQSSRQIACLKINLSF